MTTECYNSKVKQLNLNNLTRLRDDNCYNNTRDIQNMSAIDYLIKPFKDCACPSQNVQQIAINEPTITYRDGYGWTGPDGCNIDADSAVRNSQNLTNMRYIQQLYTRPYPTVPYMGRGTVNAELENILITGEDTSQKKQCNTLSGINIDRFVPLVDCLQKNIQNPIHLVEEVARKDWVRGGVPSRDIVRNTDYLMKCGYKYDGKQWLRPDKK